MSAIASRPPGGLEIDTSLVGQQPSQRCATPGDKCARVALVVFGLIALAVAVGVAVKSRTPWAIAPGVFGVILIAIAIFYKGDLGPSEGGSSSSSGGGSPASVGYD